MVTNINSKYPVAEARVLIVLVMLRSAILMAFFAYMSCIRWLIGYYVDLGVHKEAGACSRGYSKQLLHS